MKKKIIGLFVCILLVGTVVPVVEPLKTTTTTPMASSGITKFYSTDNWIEEEKLLASDGQEGDNFGCYVSLSGDTALVGAWLDGDNGYHSGSAYVFIRNNTTWTQQAKLLPSDGEEDNLFGWSVSLDNDTALIGAYWDDDNGDKSGSVYVFTRKGTAWTQQAKLLASDGAIMDYFGYSVSLSENTALISAPLDDYNGDASGSAYIFTHTGTTWTQQAKLVAADGAIGDNFGNRVFLAGDTALIGADGDDGIRGAAYVFTRTGTSWTQQAKLLASDGQGEDFFGDFVSLSGDTAIIGAAGDDDNGDWSGSAYVFIRNNTTWTQQAKLLASDGYAWDYFGDSVSLSGDTAVITAPQDDDNGVDSGSAYVFTRTGTTWTEQQKLIASDGQEGDTFGWLSVSLDGDSAIIGSCRDDDNGLDSGSAYVFTKVSENQPPEIPAAPTGPSEGLKGVEYTFSAVTADPEGDQVSYLFDWGDGTNSTWVGPYNSSVPGSASHVWTDAGNFSVKVKAKDVNGAESDWSASHSMSITLGPVLEIQDISGGLLRITAVIKNTGETAAANISWSIKVVGGAWIGKETTGKINTLAAGGEQTVSSKVILGFGKTVVTVTAEVPENQTTRSQNGTILLFFIKL
jgi:hypothetical protein